MKFFNLDALTRYQEVRWQGAVAEYNRVLADNAFRRYQSMTPAQREIYLSGIAMVHEHVGISDLDKFIAIEKRIKNPPGHPKSALFARLLNGLPALPVAPPTSYSDPWYELIEQEGPFPVTVNEVHAASHKIPYPQLTKGPCILLNRCLWQIESMNAPASRLLKLQSKLRIAGTSFFDAFTFWKHKRVSRITVPPIYDWSERLYRNVEEAIAAGPELTVRYGDNKPFLLKTERTVMLFSQDKAKQIVQGVGRNEMLRETACVFNINSLFLQAEIGPAIKPGFSGPNAREGIVQLFCPGWFLYAKT